MCHVWPSQTFKYLLLRPLPSILLPNFFWFLLPFSINCGWLLDKIGHSWQRSDTKQPSVQHIFAAGNPQIHNALSSGWHHTTSRTIESVTMPSNQTIIESFELVRGRDAIMKGRICYVVPFNSTSPPSSSTYYLTSITIDPATMPPNWKATTTAFIAPFTSRGGDGRRPMSRP